jgi:hypothetical protein
MGLAIGVAMLPQWEIEEPAAAQRMRNDLAQLGRFLLERQLPVFEEPATFSEPLKSRASLVSFPYSWLHYLRRFAAHVMRDPKWIPYPVEPGEDPAEDMVLRQMYRNLSSHLLCHSDCEGYYLPLDFQDIILDPTHELRGGALGSSYRLLEELILLCEPLEIPLRQGQLDDATAQWLADQRPTGAPFAIERLVWLALFEAARLSTLHRTAIVFY